MNKRVLASIISLSAVGLISVGAVTVIAKNDIEKNSKNAEDYLSTENLQDISGRLEQNKEIESEISLAAETDEITKYDIFYKMLNSIDYFKTAKGQVEVLDESDTITADFACNLETGDCYEISRFSDGRVNEIYADSTDEILESSTDGTIGTTIEVYSESKTVNYYSGTLNMDMAAAIPNNERITLAEDGINSYAHRVNATNTATAANALFNQDIIFNFMTVEDMWEISGEKTILDRDCIVIKGYTSDYAREKLGVYEFEFAVDKETAVIMDYEGYSENGEVVAYTRINDIEFDTDPEIKKFDKDDYAEYEHLDYSRGIAEPMEE